MNANVKDEIVISELKDKKAIPFDLLLMADPSRRSIDKYISEAIVYTADLNGRTIGCYVLCEVDKESIEMKNIAVDEKFQGKGIGTILLNDAMKRAKLSGWKKMIIGTGNSSIGQLYLYQKVGFRMTEIKADYFKINYSEPIIENGIECRDMIMLIREL